jgi:hypothetical protein
MTAVVFPQPTLRPSTMPIPCICQRTSCLLTRAHASRAAPRTYWGADGAAALSVPTREYFQSFGWSAPPTPLLAVPYVCSLRWIPACLQCLNPKLSSSEQLAWLITFQRGAPKICRFPKPKTIYSCVESTLTFMTRPGRLPAARQLYIVQRNDSIIPP